MAGIYIHIPFCRKACHYCDFHFSTSLNFKDKMLDAIHLELDQRKDFLNQKDEITSLYFGGGTPSLLSANELSKFIEHTKRFYTFQENAEITLEANPDDLSPEYLFEIRNAGINRLSIGIQSFHDTTLRYMNRVHDSQAGISAIKNAWRAGFENLTIDLIYGVPVQDDRLWMKNLEMADDLGVNHLSCYCLTVETGTPLAHLIKRKKMIPVDEETGYSQFNLLMDWAGAKGFEQYEISNFGRKDFRSSHNQLYWNNLPYLGLGPSAHSFDGTSRQWNLSHNPNYIAQVLEGNGYFEKEALNPFEKANERIMTGLRTEKGLHLQSFFSEFGQARIEQLEKDAKSFLDEGQLIRENGVFKLSRRGKMVADRVSSALFFNP